MNRHLSTVLKVNIIASIATLIFCIVISSRIYFAPIIGDETLYHFFGQNLTRGSGFFSDNWFDDKPGGMQFLYSLASILPFNYSNIESIRLFTVFFHLLETLLFLLLVQRVLHIKYIQSLAIATVYFLISTSSILEGNVSNADNFVSLFSIVAAIFSLNGRFNLAAVTIGLGFTLKQNFALEVLPSSMLLIANQVIVSRSTNIYLWQIFIRLLCQFICFIIPITLLGMSAYISGNLDNFIDVAFIKRIQSHILYKNYDFAIRYGIPIIKEYFAPYAASVIFLLIIAFRLEVFSNKYFSKDLFKFVYIPSWIIVSTIGTFVGGYFFPHYFLELVPVTTLVYFMLTKELKPLYASSFFLILTAISAYLNIIGYEIAFTMALILLICQFLKTYSSNLLLAIATIYIVASTNIINFPLLKSRNNFYNGDDFDLVAASKYLQANQFKNIFVYDYLAEIYSLSEIHDKKVFPAKFQYINMAKIITDNKNYPNDQEILDKNFNEIQKNINSLEYDAIIINYRDIHAGELEYLSSLIRKMDRYDFQERFGKIWIYSKGHGIRVISSSNTAPSLYHDSVNKTVNLVLPRLKYPYVSIELQCGAYNWKYPPNGLTFPLTLEIGKIFDTYSAGDQGVTYGKCKLKYFDLYANKSQLFDVDLKKSGPTR